MAGMKIADLMCFMAVSPPPVPEPYHCKVWPDGPSYSHAQFLNGCAHKPFYGLGGKWVKPRVRVRMGRQKLNSAGLKIFEHWSKRLPWYYDYVSVCRLEAAYMGDYFREISERVMERKA